MFVYNLDSDNTVANCLSLIERYAAKTARLGGGACPEEKLNAGRALTTHQKERIVRLRMQGMTPREVAEETGVSEPTICKVSRAAGITSSRSVRAVDAEMLKEFVRLREQGANYREIAAACKVHTSTVYKQLTNKRKTLTTHAPSNA